MAMRDGKNAVRRLRSAAVAVGGAALFVAGVPAGGVASAGLMAVASASSIHGCVNNSTRALTVPKPGRSCPSGTSRLAWNVRGPAGPAGPTGTPGWARIISGTGYHFSLPAGLAFDGRHVWVANETDNSVTEVNAADGSLVRNLSGGSYNFSEPFGLGTWLGRHRVRSRLRFQRAASAGVRRPPRLGRQRPDRPA